MDERQTGIQTEPSIPPWEQPGCFRLDCEPHRGELLRGTGIAVLSIGLLSVLLFGFGLLLAPLGVPLGVLTWSLALWDLRKMRQGVMDPDGEGLTTEARNYSLIGLLLISLGALLWVAPAFLIST